MKRRLILSNQQLISLLEVLGYQPVLNEEVQFKCSEDRSCEPVIVSSVTVRLNDCNLPFSPVVIVTGEHNYLLN